MTNVNQHTISARSWLRIGLALLVVPAMILFTGCDNNDSGIDDDMDDGPPGGTSATDANYANYDTTEAAVVFGEQSGNDLGVVPDDASDNENVRENYVKWTSDHTYHLDGRTFVNSGDTLEIEPGTVVKGIPNQDPNNASVLVVARGATILADGNPGSNTPSEADPIIFTTREDDVSDPNDLKPNLDGAWGGVIILGNGPKNFPGSRNVEGIPSDVNRASFGSDSPDPNDDSGVFRFAHIRYGGISIGAGNEINGLTMGAVGSGTTIEWVEVFNNQDDGFEWFGGNVNARYLFASRVGDDSFDIDQGFSGNLQFLLAIQAPTRGDRTGEHDSGDDGYGGGDEGDTPVANPQIYNATYIGSGPDGDGDIALKLRDNFGGNYFNSIFYDFPVQFIEVEEASGPDSRARWENGELTVESSITWKFGSVQDASTPFEDLVENGGSWGTTVADDLENSYNVTYENPGLSRDLSGDFQTVGVIPTNDVSGGQTPSGSFFEDVSYRGAFDPSGSNWAAGWTFSDEVGMFQ
ncbi:T9SS C-terminal target domain-containing protein [Salinibacter grassmerensis]|uniref:T9SS C-terminal target domain-containing protein n=1 Tax=Salinibacter grassmerensis TaxID=3040353 RepID=UPI0021E7F0B8|nr:T9SS C-terminal target domain-containing protein [Salinibacter grassmerensis]